MTKLFFAIIIIIIVLSSCTKENSVVPDYIDTISGRLVKYSIQILAADKTSCKNGESFISGKVCLYMNDSIIKQDIDENGFVVFNNLAAGYLRVVVDVENYLKVSYTTDLTLQQDTSGYDSENIRNASSVIFVLPKTGNGTAHIEGVAFAELDYTSSGLEFVPENVKIAIRILPNANLCNHFGAGRVFNICYETDDLVCQTGINGQYNIQIPATTTGLRICIDASDFVFNKIIAPSITERAVFSLKSDTLIVFSGLTKISDLIFEDQ